MTAAVLIRPRPPRELLSPTPPGFAAAPELAAWLYDAFISPAGPLHDPAHAALAGAHIGCLWTNVYYPKPGGVFVAGQAERPNFDGNKWAKARQEFQLVRWFGAVPDFVLTFEAAAADAAPDRRWCALADHELRHCVQAVGKDGMPRFDRDGRPVFTLIGHDVEEFTGVLSRYGAGACCGRTVEFVAAAAAAPPSLDDRAIARACGAAAPPASARRPSKT